MKTETIAAIATALSDFGISIIRVSGIDAIEIVDILFQTKSGRHILKKVKSHTIHYGYLYDNQEFLDEVMVSVFHGPKSYTMEDVVEINCHGGILVTNRILEALLKSGARLAEPGEFTKRAFLNGRIDLSEAEAVMDVIHSQNELSLQCSVSQLKGSVYRIIKELREKVLYEIAFIESAIDDPEHISTEGYSEKLNIFTDKIGKKIKKLIDSADNGKIVKEGIKTVILGKPNVGKSSLLNILAGEEKAIVTNIAGTTRDVLEQYIKIHGIGLNIIDTAGIRESEDVIEKIGIKKAIEMAEKADLILYVIDSSVPLDKNDFEILDFIQDKNTILLLNKTDLEPVVTEDVLKKQCKKYYPLLKISAKDNKGIDELKNMVQKIFFGEKNHFDFHNEIYITNMRHKEALMEAYESILLVKKSLEDNMPEDFYSIDLMNVYSSLGKIIGEEVGEDLINKIFSEFCMGK